MGAGGALAVLGYTVLQTDKYGDGCCYETNVPLFWAGIGAAAGGATLLVIGGRNDSVGTEIVIRPGGVMVQRRLRFKGIARADGP
jgi:hypothetical protein